MGFSYTNDLNTKHCIANNEITRPYLVKALDKDDATKEYMGFYYGYVIKHSHFTDERKDYLLLIDEATLQKDATVNRVEIDYNTIRQSTGVLDSKGRLLFVGDIISFVNRDDIKYMIVKGCNGFCYVDISDTEQTMIPLMFNKYKDNVNTDVVYVGG
jgi:hypothetical protein